VVAPFAPHVTRRLRSQFCIHQGQQVVARLLVAVAPGVQKFADWAGVVDHLFT
jgi:hypothetical protein